MKRLLISLLLISTPLFAQANRAVQKKTSRQTANVETLTANKTLTYLDAETQLLTPSGADRTVTLPSTNVWKAWTVKIVNEDVTNKLVIKSSDGDTLDTLAAVGRVEYVARQATPTDTLHWTNISKIGTLGVTDWSSACVGCVGEVVGPSFSGVTGTTGNWTNAASFSLPAGVWEPHMQATIAANAVNNSYLQVGFSIDSGAATFSDYSVTLPTAASCGKTLAVNIDLSCSVVGTTISLTSSTTYYAKIATTAASPTLVSGRMWFVRRR